MRSRVVIIYNFFWTFLFFSYVIADIGDWTTYTNKSDIRDIGIFENKIWCATNGGIYKYNIYDSTDRKGFTNTDGLASNDITTLEIDRYGNIWFGTQEGYINVYLMNSQSWETIDDIVEYEDHVIYDMQSLGDSLYVALDIGISLFHRIYENKQREVKETYKNLGKGFQVEIPVTCIYLHGQDIWAGTDYGLAKSNLNISNMQAPESWVNYTTSNSNLLSNTIRSISSLRDDIFVATDLGVCKFDGTNWIVVNDGLISNWAKKVNVLVVKNGTLYAGTDAGGYQFDLDGNRWLKLGETAAFISSLAVTENGDIWAGRSKNDESEGFSHYSQIEAKWNHFIPPGPGGNNFKGMAIDHDGVLWCCSATDGIFRFDGSTWKNIDRKDDSNFVNNNFWAVTVDPFNRKWFAGYGTGVVSIDNNDSLTFYKNDILKGNNYKPVNNVVIDGNDNVWFTIYTASDGKVVSAVSPDGEWEHFSKDDGIVSNNANELYGIGVDHSNRIWVGTVSGVTVIDYNNTLHDRTDDQIGGPHGTLTTSDGLVDNDVRSIVEDYDNIMWLGTNQGLNYWAGEVYDKGGVIHDNIQAIAVDVRNNKWFGTVAGLSVLAADNYEWTHYTTENSPLVSSNVTCFAFDDSLGKAYIGTTNGLSCFETPLVKNPPENFNQIVAGPNPFILKENPFFTIREIPDDVVVKFLTPDGMLVRNVPKDSFQNEYKWDGKSDNGEYVASGIYLYLLYHDIKGMSKVGKVAVLR